MWFGLPPNFCSGHRAQSFTCPKGGGRPEVGLPLGCRQKQPHERPQITHGNRDRPRYHPAASPGSKLDMAQRGWTARGRPSVSKRAPTKAGSICLDMRQKTGELVASVTPFWSSARDLHMPAWCCGLCRRPLDSVIDVKLLGVHVLHERVALQ